jgi:hypothetical protein
LEEFHGDAIPPYAILSHTWGKEEVTFHDLTKQGHRQKRGYAKIEGCCQRAASDGLAWVWVDTCCIEKSSSAELSEAINSMFRWYEASRICYAYLEDVPSGQNPFESRSAFQMSRWFTRGWTLQELLAPRRIVFFASDWKPVFDSDIDQLVSEGKMISGVMFGEDMAIATRPWVAERNRQVGLLSGITSISRRVLDREVSLSSVSAACKFSWAATRVTTRVEDMAYCLLGLLGVNMPLLYGEGDKAFVRLQEAVLSNSEDISILAWGYDLSWKVEKNETQASVLARSATAFLGYPRGNYRHVRRMPRAHTTMTGHGLHIELLMLPVDKRNKVWLGVIEEYAGQHNEGNQVGIAIVLRQSENENALLFHRAGGCPPIRSFYPHRKKRGSRGPRLKMIYLQDSVVTPLRIIDVGVDHGLLRRFHPWLRGSKIPNHRPRISISLAAVNEAGFFLSSLYPPIGQGFLVTRRPGFPFGRSFESLDCEGPQNRIFYSIFASDRENRFAVKIQVQWGTATAKSIEMSFCKLNVNLHGTALEHFCQTQIGWKAPQFKRFTQWKEYVNLWSPLAPAAGHIRVVESSYRHPLATSPIDYSLEWITGYRLEGGTVL